MDTQPISRRTVIVAGGAAVVASFAKRSAIAGERSCRDFAGTYRHKGGEAELKMRDAAIDDVVKQMNVLVRAIARSKLKESNPIAQALSISESGTLLTVSMDARAYTAPIDGKSVKVKGITGDELELHYEISNGALFQFFRGDDKGRGNGFFFDGDELKMRVRVYSSKLPRDVVYTLTYEKV